MEVFWLLWPLQVNYNYQIFISRISGRGNVLGPVCSSVYPSVSVSVWLNRWTYGPKRWHMYDQGQKVKASPIKYLSPALAEEVMFSVPSVCSSVYQSVSVCVWLNRWTYGPKRWYMCDQGQRSEGQGQSYQDQSACNRPKWGLVTASGRVREVRQCWRIFIPTVRGAIGGRYCINRKWAFSILQL